MATKHLFQKAKTQLFLFELLIQAEGWEIDTDWVARGKDGRFGGSNNVKSKTSSDKDTANLASSIQSDFQSLSSDQKNIAKNTVNLPVFTNFKSSIENHLSNFSGEAAKVYNKCIKDVGNAVDPKKITASIEKTKKYYEDNPIQMALDGAKLALELGTGVALLSCLYCTYGSVVLASALVTGTSGFTPEALSISLAVYGSAAIRSGVKTMINAISLTLVNAIDKQVEMEIKQRELIANLNKEFNKTQKIFPKLIPTQYQDLIK